ncbi:AAA domain protein [compost metagenome]
MKAILFVLSGLPGAGKSTISQFLARKYKAMYLRIDTIEQRLRDLYNSDVAGEGYSLAYQIAADNLKLAINVVADSCNPIFLTRKKWEEVAINNNSIFINIEVICSDKNEHRKRIETRNAEVEGLKLPTWAEVQNREYHPWKSQRVLIDTANKSIEATLEELDKDLSFFFQ